MKVSYFSNAEVMLILRADQLQVMQSDARKTYPEECCGLLLGVWDEMTDRRQVQEIWPLRNQWTVAASEFTDRTPSTQPLSKANRYWIDPKDLLAAQKYVREQNWVVLGVYHSHPDHPAVPSERDRQMAWSNYSYPILSVTAEQVLDVQSWRLNSADQFEPESIELIQAS